MLFVSFLRLCTIIASLLLQRFEAASADDAATQPHIPQCCPPGWQLARLNTGLFRREKFDCINPATIGKFADDLEVFADTAVVFGYRIAPPLNMSVPRCEHQTLILFARDGGDVELTPRSCLTNVAGRLAAVSCPLIGEGAQKQDFRMQRLSVVHKCCPSGHFYDALQRRCLLQQLSNGLAAYRSFFQHAVAFTDEPVKCPRHKALIEYRLSALEFGFADGQLRLLGKRFDIGDYCVEQVVGDALLLPTVTSNVTNVTAATTSFLVRTCTDVGVCERLPCIRRCCADGEMYTKGSATAYCKRDDSDIAFHSFESLEISGNFSKPPVFGVLRSLDCLKYRLDPDAYSDEAHTISERDGSLYVMNTKKNYTNNNYCVEKVHNASWGDQKLYTFLCFDSKVVGNDKIRFKMYPIGLLISCSFYAMTLLVYLSISRLRNRPGKILICLVCSLFAAYLGIALGQLMPTPNDNVCFASAFFVYFCLMAAFAWMNVTCFDIWQAFGSTKKNGFKSSHTKRFLLYSLYGWGLPTVLTAITVALTKSDLLSDNIKPHFGHGRCWFTYDTLASANLLFFSGPVGILFLFNFILFSMTLRYCNKVKREIFRMQSSNMEKPVLRRRFFVDKARFAMNTKLFVVMGITWLLELLSILFYDHKKTFFWIVSDSFNVLLGVFVFFIFVFKKRVWHSILEKVGLRSKDNRKNAPNATGVTHSTCAQSMSMVRPNTLLVDGNIKLLSPGTPTSRRSPSISM